MWCILDHCQQCLYKHLLFSIDLVLFLASRISASSNKKSFPCTFLSSLNILTSPTISSRRSFNNWCNISDSTRVSQELLWISKLCVCFKFKVCWFPENVLMFHQLQFFPMTFSAHVGCASNIPPHLPCISSLSWVLYFPVASYCDLGTMDGSFIALTGAICFVVAWSLLLPVVSLSEGGLQFWGFGMFRDSWPMFKLLSADTWS